MPKKVWVFWIINILSLLARDAGAYSLVSIYNERGQRVCYVPRDIRVSVWERKSSLEGFSKIQLPPNFKKSCGEIGYVRASLLAPPAKPPSPNLEAQGGLPCTRCQTESARSQTPNMLQTTAKQISSMSCVPPTLGRKDPRSWLGATTMEEAIKNYSLRAAGMVKRAYLSLAPSEGTLAFEKLKALTQNFQDFDSLDPDLLKPLLRRSSHDCYKFIKAALSNDYAPLENYNRQWRSYSSRRGSANTSLVRRQCGNQKGDLVSSYWWARNSHEIDAGNADGPLRAQGFLNLMDPRWGVHHQYKNEKTAPEGSILVFKCGHKGGCHRGFGDVAIKTRTGYLRDYFSKHTIADNGRYKLVGIYIKPGG